MTNIRKEYTEIIMVFEGVGLFFVWYFLNILLRLFLRVFFRRYVFIILRYVGNFMYIVFLINSRVGFLSEIFRMENKGSGDFF